MYTQNPEMHPGRDEKRTGRVHSAPMAIELTKRWRALDAGTVHAVPGQLGVYELGDEDGRVVYVGFAGGRSPFGLRSELQGHLGNTRGATRFRYEVNMQYQTRYRELLMAHVARDGALPPMNRTERPISLGRISPG